MVRPRRPEHHCHCRWFGTKRFSSFASFFSPLAFLSGSTCTLRNGDFSFLTGSAVLPSRAIFARYDPVPRNDDPRKPFPPIRSHGLVAGRLTAQGHSILKSFTSEKSNLHEWTRVEGEGSAKLSRMLHKKSGTSKGKPNLQGSMI